MFSNLFSTKKKSPEKHNFDEFPSILDNNQLDAQFKGLVDTFSELGLKHKIKNDNGIHAEYALISLFNYAEKNIEILTESLGSSKKRSREYLTALFNFVAKPDTILKVVVENDDVNSQGLNLIKYLKKQYASKIEIRKLSKPQTANYNGGEHSNYTIVDNIAYRFEYVPEHKKAHVCFNNSEEAIKLFSHFNESVLPASTEITNIPDSCIQDGKHIAESLNLQ